MHFSKLRHWLTCAAGLVALFCWSLVTRWPSGEVLQRVDELRVSSMNIAASQLGAGAVAGWIAGFLLSYLILSRFAWHGTGDRRIMLSYAAAVPLGVIAFAILRRIDGGSLDQLVPFLDLSGSAFPGLVIGWCASLAASLLLMLPGDGWGQSTLTVFAFGLIGVVYIGTEGIVMGPRMSGCETPMGLAALDIPAGHFAFGLLAGWVLPFLARRGLKIPAWWFALSGVTGLAVLIFTGWLVSAWPPGSGRWTEPHLMEGFWPPFFNGLFIGIAAAGCLLAALRPGLPSGEAVPESGTL